MENVIIVTECNAPWENEPTGLPSTSAATTWHRGKMTPAWENEEKIMTEKEMAKQMYALGYLHGHVEASENIDITTFLPDDFNKIMKLAAKDWTESGAEAAYEKLATKTA